jgi:tetratricopeptide (TPR) repeat protein
MLPVSEIAAEVAKSLDFLETEMGDVPDRHRSIRAVFDYSWALLSDTEREMFAALSVFKGGFTREAAQAVAGASLRNLATLSNKSLVTPSPDTGRYAIHEMLRNYAQDELRRDSQGFDQALEVHAGFYGDLTEKATELIFESDQPKMRAIIESDIENIRSAWRHYLSTANAAGALRLLPGLQFVYEWQGWYPAGVAIFGEAAPALAGASDSDEVVALRSMAKAVQGWFLSLLGQPEVGAAAASEAVESLPESVDKIYRWTALQCQAVGMVYLGRTDELAGILDRAIDEYQTIPDPYWAAGLKNWRAFAAFMGGDLETAQRLIPEAMAVFEPRNEHYYTIWNLWLQAMGATWDGRPIDAIDLYARQVARSEELGYLRGKVVAFEGLGDANLAADRMEAAETAFIQGIEVAEQMGMVTDILSMMTKVASARAAMTRETAAVELLATVCAEPASLRQAFTANLPIRDMATASLGELQDKLAGDDYSAAYARGAAKPYEVAAKELMDSLTR